MTPRRARPGAAVAEDHSLPVPELPLLEDAVGGLEFRLRATSAASEDAPFSVAGRRAFAAGGAARGVDEVWAHPVRLAARLGVAGSAPESLVVTPLGVERRVRAGGAELLERVVVPQEAPCCIVEWLSVGRSVEVEVGWVCDLRLPAPHPPGALGPLRWRRTGRGVVVAGAGEDRAVFAFSEPPASLDVEDVSAQGRPLARVRARLRLTRRVPQRLAIAGAAGDAPLRRALAAADRAAGITRARRGSAERLMRERLSLDAPSPAAVQALEWAKHRLEARLAEAPEVGRSLLAGHGSSPGAPFDHGSCPGPRFVGPDGARGALAACAAGSFRTARDVLVFLGRHLDAAGRAPAECSTAGVARYDAPEATPLYLLLAARYMAWTGDLGTLRAEWPRVLRARDAALRDEESGDASVLLGGALAELADAAEAIGARETAIELRRAADDRGGTPWAAASRPGTPIGDLVHEMLGAEPDAARGRLVLRPEPPPDWSWFRVAGLAMAGAVLSMEYRGAGARHTFRLTQDRGASPLRVILEPRLRGAALRSARVDGVGAELDARPQGDKLIVPVQVVLDHEREIVLELDESTETERRRH